MSEWRTRALGDFIKQKYELAGKAELPVMSVGKIYGVIPQSIRFGKRIASKETQRYPRIAPGDFVYDPMLLWDGSVSRMDYGYEGIVSPAYNVFTVDGSVHSDFLLYLLKSSLMRNRYGVISQGTNVRRKKASFEDFSAIEVPLPPLSEQKKIAEVLSSVDHSIEKTERLIAKLKELKKAMLQELLTKGIGHTKFKDSPVGRIPEEWDVVRLADCVRSDITYGIVQAGPHIAGGVPYIRTGDMTNGKIDQSQLMRTSEAIAAKFDRSKVDDGDLVFALRATIGNVVEVPDGLGGANLTQGTARIAPRKDISTRFLLWAIRSSPTQQDIAYRTKGSTFKEITLADLREVNVVLPADCEQRRIAACMDGLEHREEVLRGKRNVVLNIKKALMQDLLTGRVRVKV